MKAVWIVLVLAVLLTGCKNRFETYEPYSAFDDHMAAADPGSAPSSASKGSSNSEVPFTTSRSPKHAMNIGAM